MNKNIDAQGMPIRKGDYVAYIMATGNKSNEFRFGEIIHIAKIPGYGDQQSYHIKDNKTNRKNTRGAHDILVLRSIMKEKLATWKSLGK